MNNALVGLLALGGIAYYIFNKKSKTKVAGGNELKAEDEKIVTETTPVNHDT